MKIKSFTLLKECKIVLQQFRLIMKVIIIITYAGLTISLAHHSFARKYYTGGILGWLSSFQEL